MGNRSSITVNPLNYKRNSQNETLHELYNELKDDLTERLLHGNRTNKEKFDTICLYSNIRELLFLDNSNEKHEMKLLIEQFEKTYYLTHKQRKIINLIYDYS